MEGGGLLDQLGINWKLLVSQAVNFFILLLVLRFFVYKPLLAVIKKRNEKITLGLTQAKEAEERLKEVDGIAKGMVKKAGEEAIEMIKTTEEKAEALKQLLQKKAEDRQKELMAQAEASYKKQQEETKRMVFKEAMELVKKTIIKTVQMDPKYIDQALIEKAATQIKDEV